MNINNKTNFGKIYNQYKKSWGLKCINFNDFFLIFKQILKEYLNINLNDNFLLEAHLVNDCEADSIDILALSSAFEEHFRKLIKEFEISFYSYDLKNIIFVKDLFVLLYDTLLKIEKNEQ